MQRDQREQHSPSCLAWVLVLLVGTVSVVALTFKLYRPDSPHPRIPPGSSTAPSFVIQIIRPREGLPLAGLLPPQLFGVDAHLEFDSATEGASYSIGQDRLEFSADGWDLKLVHDGEGRITAETEIVFEIIFEGHQQRVRCRPGEPILATLHFNRIEQLGELSGYFDVELANCEDAETGRPLGWPPRPFVLHGSFDRLPVGEIAE